MTDVAHGRGRTGRDGVLDLKKELTTAQKQAAQGDEETGAPSDDDGDDRGWPAGPGLNNLDDAMGKVEDAAAVGGLGRPRLGASKHTLSPSPSLMRRRAQL